jgi:hypothetical protein
MTRWRELTTDGKVAAVSLAAGLLSVIVGLVLLVLHR